jgi:hypothetical protein
MESLAIATNCAENINGHGNEDTPRRNCFSASMFRLAVMVDYGIRLYGPSVQRSCNSATRREEALMRTVAETEIEQQKMNDNTDMENGTCECGQAFHFSAIFAVPIQCFRLRAGDKRKSHMDTRPTLMTEQDPAQPERVLETRTCLGQSPSYERKSCLVEMAARSIKRLSKTEQKFTAVTDWMNDNLSHLNSEIRFVQNIPLPLDAMISEGVTVFGFSP